MEDADGWLGGGGSLIAHGIDSAPLAPAALAEPMGLASGLAPAVSMPRSMDARRARAAGATGAAIAVPPEARPADRERAPAARAGAEQEVLAWSHADDPADGKGCAGTANEA